MLVASFVECSFATSLICSCGAIVFVTKHSSFKLTFSLRNIRFSAGCRVLLGGAKLVCEPSGRVGDELQ